MSISHLASALSLHPAFMGTSCPGFPGVGREGSHCFSRAGPTNLSAQHNSPEATERHWSPRQVSLLYGVFKASGVVVVPILGQRGQKSAQALAPR